MTTPTRRPAIFGPEPWATVAGSQWCHFDRWFALVAVTGCDGDLDALEQELVARHRSVHGRHDVDAKLSHLADLRDRLAAAGLEPATLAAAQACDNATMAKARRKVLDQADATIDELTARIEMLLDPHDAAVTVLVADPGVKLVDWR